MGLMYSMIILGNASIPVFSPEFCKQRVKIKKAKGTTDILT